MRKKSKQELSRLAGSGGSVLRIGINHSALLLRDPAEEEFQGVRYRAVRALAEGNGWLPS